MSDKYPAYRAHCTPSSSEVTAPERLLMRAEHQLRRMHTSAHYYSSLRLYDNKIKHILMLLKIFFFLALVIADADISN